jgi:hypothetical protein
VVVVMEAACFVAVSTAEKTKKATNNRRKTADGKAEARRTQRGWEGRPFTFSGRGKGVVVKGNARA